MNEWTGKFCRTEVTPYGDKVVFSSAKGEWKPMDVNKGLDLSNLKKDENYKIVVDRNDKGYMFLVSYEKAEPRQWRGGGGGRAYDPLNFVSNVVGQAIQAQLIKQPSDVAAWAHAAWAVSEKQ